MRLHVRITALALVALLLAAVGAPSVGAEGSGPSGRTYTVTVTNLTERQILTPPVFAAHTGAANVFDVGRPASEGVKEIAENGNLTPLVDALAATRGVLTSGIGGGAGGPLMPGTDRTFEFGASTNARNLSIVQMVVCTNDGFIGLDSLRLPTKKHETVTVYLFALDAGTEINTDDVDDFVPPCSGGASGTGVSNPALAENGVIAPHPGLVGEAAAQWGFGATEPIAEIEVTRVG